MAAEPKKVAKQRYGERKGHVRRLQEVLVVRLLSDFHSGNTPCISNTYNGNDRIPVATLEGLEVSFGALWARLP